MTGLTKRKNPWVLLAATIIAMALMTSITFAEDGFEETSLEAGPAAVQELASDQPADSDQPTDSDQPSGNGPGVVSDQPTDIAEAATIEDIPAVTYTGEQQRPAPVLFVESYGDLVEGTDYTVSYGENVNAGTGTVTVNGIGRFCGSLTKEFTIEPMAVKPKVTLSKRIYTWNNKDRKPEVTVKIGDTVLEVSQYTLSWPNDCKSDGTCWVNASLTGNYSGKISASYKINPKGTSLSGLKAASRTITATWTKQASKMSVSRITGYQLQYSRYKSFKSAKKVNVKGYSKATRKLTNLKSSSKYYVRIRTYTKKDDTTYFSVWSGAKSIKTKAYKPKILVFDNNQENLRVVRMLQNNGCRAEMLWTNNIDVSKYDGLVIPGGHNIDPRMYGAKQAPETYGTNIDKDKAQIAMIKKFADAKKPVLGLCRGCQVINVAYGGTICQHIPGWHKWNRTIKIKKGSWLYSAYGAKTSVYHFHHQCVEKLGTGLAATQWDAADGRIEAVEHKTLPVYGVQWHPDSMEERGNAVFIKFRKVCVKQKESNI